MGNIRSTVGNIAHDVQDNLAEILNQTSTKMENIVGTAQTQLTHLWSGGFTGMSQSGMEALKDAVSNYCDSVEAKIRDFNETANIENAVKGRVNEAATAFIAAVKELLEAYVSTTRQEIAEASEAWENWKATGESISLDVESAAQDIRGNAETIRLD